MLLAKFLARPSARSMRTASTMLLVLGVLLGPLAIVAHAATPIEMGARVLLQGHARVGSWMAIEVDLANDGPAVKGEIQLAGGASGRTRFSVPVDLPTNSRQSYVLHAQPPAFGRSVKVELMAGGSTIGSTDVTFQIHDATQLVVGVIAEQPQGIIAELNLDPNQAGLAPSILALGIADLPDRLEAWGTLDRLIWQDIDSNLLTADQLAALRGWIAGGGRLVITGGTAGIGTYSGFPDVLLPYRPTATVDIAPTSLTGIIGEMPANATDLPAQGGTLRAGRSLATSGDRVVAAEMDYGSGSVTVLGFDPATSWLAATRDIDAMWRRLLPQRSAGGPVVGSDDSQIVNAVNQLASLALPPIGGLLLLIGGYILLIGPINYLVLRRLDRRELAWITMPVLIGAFAVGSYGFGTTLRGTDLIVNEVAVVRGAPGATEGAAQVYVGIYSPVRSTYQLEFRGGALLAAPASGDFAGNGDPNTLDIVQGDPAVVRDLAVGFSSLRTVRADAPASVPLVTATITFSNGLISGGITNASSITLEKVALVLGGSVAVIGDMEPGSSKQVSLRPSGNPFFESLSDRMFGQVFFGDSSQLTDEGLRIRVRRAVVDQLTFDPMFGTVGAINASGPVILAWGRDAVLDVQVQGQRARRNANVLYYLPVGLDVSGKTTFTSDLITSTVVSSDAAFFNKDPFSVNLGSGSATLAYRPISFRGSLAASDVQFSLNGGAVPGAGAIRIKPLDKPPVACTDSTNSNPAGCAPPRLDGIPEIDVFDVAAGAWVRLPHLGQGAIYALDDPAPFVDPATGQMLLRFVNESADQGLGFQFQLSISGVIS
ncbi:MAG: hypothetical protein HYX54_02850 [Chloroflexi bacterium]|nr:hypothetical protein [Chloroflexota bacterium]